MSNSVNKPAADGGRPGFIVPAPFEAEWFELEPHEVALAWRILMSLPDALEIAPRVLVEPSRARAAALTFYGPGRAVVDFETRTTHGPACVSLLTSPKQARLVRGATEIIHAMNRAERLNIACEDGSAAAYLRYFVGLTWADLGAFSLVESRSALYARFGAKTVVDFKDLAEPLVIKHRDGSCEAKGLLSYSGTLSVATFEIAAGGYVTMTEEDKKLEETAEPLVSYASPFRFPATSEKQDFSG